MNVQVIGDIHISMTQEARKYLYINAFVIAVRGECVPKDVFPSVFYPCFFTGFACLVSQCLVGEPFAIVIGENPFIYPARILFFQYVDRLGRERDCSPAAFAFHAVLNKGLLLICQPDNRIPDIDALARELYILPPQSNDSINTNKSSKIVPLFMINFLLMLPEQLP